MKTYNPYRMWLKKHRNSLNGAICIVVAIALFVWIVVYGGNGGSNNDAVSVVTILIALYALTRGVFTMVLNFRENDLGLSVYRHVCIELYNQLFFVYERMLWIWVLLPALTSYCWLMVGNAETRKWMVAVMGTITIVLLSVFTKPLIRKRRYLRKRIKEIENDLVKTNASS